MLISPKSGTSESPESASELPIIPPEEAARIWPGGFTIRDEANALVANAFRNGPIEKLHEGANSELLDDQSLSRITDAEMKRIMLFACERLALLLQIKEYDPKAYRQLIKDYNYRYCQRWNRKSMTWQPRRMPDGSPKGPWERIIDSMRVAGVLEVGVDEDQQQAN